MFEIKFSSNSAFFKFWAVHLAMLCIFPLATQFLAFFYSVNTPGPYEFYDSSKLGELGGLVFLLLSLLVINHSSFISKVNKLKFSQSLNYNSLFLNIFIYFVFLFFSLYVFRFDVGLIFTSFFIWIVYNKINYDVKNNIFYSESAKALKSPVEYKKLLLYISLIYLFLAVSWLNGRLNYFSLHLSEFTLIPFFWDIGSESLFSYFPRHGLFEVSLGKVLLNMGFDVYKVGYLGEFIVKTASIFDILALSYWINKFKLDAKSKNIIYLIILLYFMVSWQVGTYIFILSAPVILLDLLQKKNLLIITACLGFFNTLMFFMRWEYGAFSLVATYILLYSYKVRYFRYCILYSVWIIFFFFIALHFLNASFIQFIEFIKALSNNTKVWGWPTIDSRAGYIFFFTFLSSAFLTYLYKNRDKFQELAPFNYLALLLIFNFVILTGRSDTHVYFSCLLLNLIPLIVLTRKTPLFFKQNSITKFGVLILLIPLFIIMTDKYMVYGVFYKYQPFNFIKAHSAFVNFPKSEHIWPYSNESKNKILELSNDIAYKNKITFIPLNPFEYVIFSTKPIGIHADLLHQSQSIDSDNQAKSINESNVVVYFKKFHIDGYNSEERFSFVFSQLSENYLTTFEDDDVKILIKR